jgi:hypothetical protein
MKRQLTFILPAFAFLAWMLSSCSGETKTYTVTTPELTLIAEGPLFEGSNTATADWKFNAADFFDGRDPASLKFKEAKIKYITIIGCDENETMPEIDEIVVEIAAPGTSMMRVGYLQQNIEPCMEYSMQVADIQKNLEDFFKQSGITFVADLNVLDEEYWENAELKIKMEFEFSVR